MLSMRRDSEANMAWDNLTEVILEEFDGILITSQSVSANPN